jgi:acyl-CoA thioesterase-2
VTQIGVFSDADNPMSELPSTLRIENLGGGRWSALNPAMDPEGRDVIFSGQILGQMIMASDAASTHQKVVKSIHVIFIRTGAYTSGPIEFALEPMHAGRAWASDTVTAYQGDRLLSRGLVLLNAIESDLIRHAATMPDLPGPDDCIPIERPVLFPGIEAREVDVADPVSANGAPARYLWLRMPTSFDSVAANQAIAAWCQPGFIIELAMRPHRDTANIREAHRSISTGVISHTTHFHDGTDVSRWLLFTQEATFAGNGRVGGSGAVFSEDGTLVSTFHQDAMVRGTQDALDPRRSM